MDSISFEINDLVMVEFRDEKWPGAFPSRVEDKSREKAVLAWPVDNGMRVPITQADRLLLTFVQPDAIYRVEVIVENTRREPLPMVEVAFTGKVERVQRREYVRISAMLPVEMAISPEEGDKAKNRLISSFRTNTIDVSGNGIAIHHKLAIPVKTLYDAKLTIPGQPPPLELQAMVVRCTAVQDAQQEWIHRIGFMFVSLAENQRSRLVRHIFDLQRKAMQKGILLQGINKRYQ